MENVKLLLELPISTLAPLVAGYIGYRIAYVGHDGAHGAADVVFLSLAFALAGKLVMVAFGGLVIPGAVMAVLLTGAVAAAWRKWGASFVLTWLRKWRISDHDRGRTVWESMLTRNDLSGPSQLRITLKDTRELMCDDLSRFNDHPLGPCLLGPDGSVALYVTSHRKSGGEWTEIEAEAIDDPHLGAEMTFIPASEVARVRIRRVR